jgi:signal transduction histidine kinase
VTPTTLRRRLLVAFVAIGAVTALGLSAVVLTAVRSVAAQNRVTQTLFTSYAGTAELNQAILDEDIGFRGFALTREERFLQRYVEGQRTVEVIGKRLDANEGHLPQIRAARRAVLARVQEWRTSVLDPAIARVRAGGRVTTADLVRSQEEYDAVRAAAARYRALILAERKASVRDLERQNVTLYVVIGLGLTLLLVIGVLSWLGLRRWVIQPLEQLGHEVDRVEHGELAHEVVVTASPAEIATLAGQIDRMRLRILEEYASAVGARHQALEAQQLVEEQAEDLRRSNAELEQFAYVASHDLQEPLRKVASFCQLLERRYKDQLDERGEQYIAFAVDGAKRMQQLINDLLAFSRVGRMTTGFTDVDLDQAFSQAVAQLDVVISESGAQVTSDPLPSVEGAQSLLVQLFQNLVGNGVKFHGDAPPRVHIGVTPAGDMWEFTCRDNGIGIEPQYEEKIFVIFQRLHGRDVYSGTGIGLAMCKKIVEYHGGRMWLDTTVTDGAAFRWTLPVNQGGPTR